MKITPIFVAIWGVGGVLALLAQAIAKLTPIALEPFGAGQELGWLAVGAYIFSVIFMAYSEGYKGFHKKFSPRVVARAAYLAKNPRPLWLALAPAFCTGLIGASRKRMIIAWILPVAIVVLVLIVRGFPQPWRGAVDAGVVVGLSIGSASILYHAVRAIRGTLPDTPLDLPESVAARPETGA